MKNVLLVSPAKRALGSAERPGKRGGKERGAKLKKAPQKAGRILKHRAFLDSLPWA